MHNGGGNFGSKKHGVSGHGGTRSHRVVARENAERAAREKQEAQEREAARVHGLNYNSASDAVKNRRKGRR